MAIIHFTAPLEKIKTHTILRVPKDESAKLPSRGQVMVAGTINGHKLHTALEPDGNWNHWLDVDDALQKAADIHAGDIVELAIDSTKEWPEPTIPADWQVALDADAEVRARWEAVTPMARWEWLRWIASSGNPDTRKHHIEVSCSKLLAGERRPCCFNRNMCCVPEVSKSGVLLEPATSR